MKLNFADRRTDKNIVNKKFIMSDSNDEKFKGKISLIEIEKLNENFEVIRPNGTTDLVIAKDYKIMTYFPKKEKYCMTAMFDNDWNLKQWYFDIGKSYCKYDGEIPYSEDLYLDLVVLPDGTFYALDENELKEALLNNIVSKEEYDIAFSTMYKIMQMIKDDFKILYNFTMKSVELLKNRIGD